MWARSGRIPVSWRLPSDETCTANLYMLEKMAFWSHKMPFRTVFWIEPIRICDIFDFGTGFRSCPRYKHSGPGFEKRGGSNRWRQSHAAAHANRTRRWQPWPVEGAAPASWGMNGRRIRPDAGRERRVRVSYAAYTVFFLLADAPCLSSPGT